MKKILAMLLAVVISFGLVPAYSANGVGPAYGDVDGNGVVTAADALLALQNSVGKVSLDNNQKILADVDGDGNVTAADALLILQYAVGKIYIFPASLKDVDNMTESLDGEWKFYADKNPVINEYASDITQEETPENDTGHAIIIKAPSGNSYAANSLKPGEEGKMSLEIPVSELNATMKLKMTSSMLCADTASASAVLKAGQGVKLVLTDASGKVSEISSDISKTDFPVGFSVDDRMQKYASISFSGIDTSKTYSSAAVSFTAALGANVSEQTQMAFISVNGNWSYMDLSGDMDGNNRWMTADVPVSDVVNGNNEIVLDSNVISTGNSNNQSFDLFHNIHSGAAQKSYIANSLSELGSKLHSDRDLMVTLKLKKSDGTWDELKYDTSSVNTSCVVGMYLPQNLKYYQRQDFTVTNVSQYTAAQVCIFARCGKNAYTDFDSLEYSFYTSSADTSRVQMSKGKTVGFTLKTDAAYSVGDFCKLGLNVRFGDVPENGKLYARIGDGEWYALPVAQYSGQTAALSLPVSSQDIVNGENTFEVKTDFDEPVYIKCAESASSTSYIIENGETTPLQTVVEASLTVYKTQGLTLEETSVPSAWETVGATDTDDGPYAKYNGTAWYERSFDAGEISDTEHLKLCFGAVDYACEVWVNSVYLGFHEGGYDPFCFELDNLGEALLKTGNTLTVRVTDQTFSESDEYYIKATLAGFLQDSIGMNYAGIWQSVTLERVNDVAVTDVYARSESDLKTANVTVGVFNYSDEDKDYSLLLNISGGKSNTSVTEKKDVTVKAGQTATVDFAVELKNPSLWSADEPYMYTASAFVMNGSSVVSKTAEKFGMRTITTSGSKFVLNGSNIFLTGVIDWLYNYETFDPAVSPETMRAQIESLKAAGFNAIKFVLVVPPEYILDICDEMGMYTYIEYPIWNPTESEEFYSRAYSQLPKLITKDRNHPSLILSDFSCEQPSFTADMDSLLEFAVNYGKQNAGNRLYLDNSSNGTQRYGDFSAVHPYNQLNKFDDVIDSWSVLRGTSKPIVLGEFADTDTLRDVSGITGEFDGEKPWWWSVLGITDSSESLKKLGYTDAQIEKLITASYDNALESKLWYIMQAKKNNNIGGLFVTHMNDISSTRAGLFDELNNFKFDAEQMKGTAGEASVLLECQSRNVLSGEKFTVTPSLSYYNAKSLDGAKATYALKDKSGKTVSSGSIASSALDKAVSGGVYNLGATGIDAPQVTECTEYTLTVTVKCDAFEVSNDFSFWVYPNSYTNADGVKYYDPSNTLKLSERYSGMTSLENGVVTGNPKLIVATAITDSIKQYVNAGGKLIYAGTGNEFARTQSSLYFTRLSLNYVLDPTLECLGGIGADGYGAVQFLELATTTVMTMNSFATDNRIPIIGQLDLRGFKTYSLLQRFEYGSGTVLQTTLRLGDDEIRIASSVVNGDALYQDSYKNVIGRYLLDCMIKSEL